MTDMPMPDDDLFESIEELVGFLARMNELLSDPMISSMRLVLNPEKMVIKEAQRAYTYLNLYGYSVDAVVCNRVFPKELSDSYFDAWKSSQSENLELIREAFHPLPIFEIPFFAQEVTGIDMLRLMAQSLFGAPGAQGDAGDPTQHFYLGKPQEIFRQDNHYILSIPLPLVAREQVNLHRSVYDELIVRIGNWKRNISLPMMLAKLEIDGAKYVDDRLNISFKVNAEIDGAHPELAPDALRKSAWQNLLTRMGGK
jgi:arsenite-transporting ATPase